MVEQSLAEIDVSIIEASRSLGATMANYYESIIARPKSSLLSGLAVTTVSVIGYTSFAGYIAAGGLIVEAFNLGYYGTDQLGMWICVFIVVIIVQVVQEGGLYFAKKLDKRRIIK